MKVWDIYALIGSNNIVQNIALYEVGEGGYTLANVQAVELYGDGAYAVDVTQIPVGIGDVYENGRFYREGVLIERVPTQEEQVQYLTAQNEELNSTIDDLIVAMTPSI